MSYSISCLYTCCIARAIDLQHFSRRRMGSRRRRMGSSSTSSSKSNISMQEEEEGTEEVGGKGGGKWAGAGRSINRRRRRRRRRIYSSFLHYSKREMWVVFAYISAPRPDISNPIAPPYFWECQLPDWKAGEELSMMCHAQCHRLTDLPSLYPISLQLKLQE